MWRFVLCGGDENLSKNWRESLYLTLHLLGLPGCSWHETFILWYHFSQCPLEIGSASACRKGGTGRGWWAHLKGADSMAVFLLSFRNIIIVVGFGWATVALLCMNGLKRQSSHLAWHPFLTGKLFPSLVEWLSGETRDYCNFVNG